MEIEPEDACDKDAVVNHAVVLIGYGHSNEDRKACYSTFPGRFCARTIGTSEIAGATPGGRAASSGCYGTTVTRESRAIAAPTGSPRKELDVTMDLQLFQSVACVAFSRCLGWVADSQFIAFILLDILIYKYL